MPDGLRIGDAVEGFHVAAVVAGLDRLGVLDAMAAPATPADLAGPAGVDAGLLALCLEYLAGRSDVVERHGDRYAVTPAWDGYARASVRQYVGAYGPLSAGLAAVLRDPAAGAALVDRGEQARSYAEAPTVARLVADLVLQLDLAPTLDLGCGSGTMLVDLGRRDPGFTGWGVDASAAMCATARGRIAAAGLADRIEVIEGDAFDARSAAAAVPAGQVRSITATSLLNELWGGDGGGDGRGNGEATRPSVAAWLRSLAAAFPGRPLVVTDYFGQLGHTPPPWRPGAALHDLVQALSGQGVPPADHGAWRDAYAEAGAQLLHVVEDDARSFFIHLLRLPGG